MGIATTNGTQLGHSRFGVSSEAPAGSGLDLTQLLPDAWVGGVYTSGAPEVRQLGFGILPLVDCAPIVVAHERGLFKSMASSPPSRSSPVGPRAAMH